MTFKNFNYIFSAILAVVLLAGCADESLYPDDNPAGNPDAVTFSAGVGNAAAMTRSDEKQLYQPLELTSGSSDFKLYLHTYDSETIGHEPGEDASVEATRGYQIESVDALYRYHQSFMVRADYDESNEQYIEWSNAKPSSVTGDQGSVSDIWITDRTRYWPGQQRLSFHAMAPASLFDEVTGQNTSMANTYMFSYAARKGETDNDAKAQKDLLFATSTCTKAESVNGKAPLKFNHALSAVKFAIRDVLNGEVVNIKIKNIYGKGQCVYTADEDGSNGNFEWSSLEGKETYSQNFGYKITDRKDQNNAETVIQNQSGMEEYTFMLIPQEIPADAEIEVTLRRTGLDPMPGDNVPEYITVSAKIQDNALSEWLPGHEYVYTISTSKDNWVTVFKVRGNYNSKTKEYGIDRDDADQIYVYSPSEPIPGTDPVEYYHDKYLDKANYSVLSYRYRANNQKVTEPLPWTAATSGTHQYEAVGTFPGKQKKETFDLTAEQWIPGQKNLHDTGNSQWKRYPIEMLVHHQATDWPGDEWMQEQDFYKNGNNAIQNDATHAWDLSTCGGNNSINTANCYVIDRAGWYKFPLVYGNSYTDGKPISTPYDDANFVNHLGSHISSQKIDPNYCKSANLVWSDIYNTITDIKVVNGEDGFDWIYFQANRGNMQQGNAIIALYDGNNNVVWSWHIWVTEHWLDPKNGMPHVFNNSTAFTAWNDDNQSYSDERPEKWRKRGDLLLENTEHGVPKVYMSPYNLGWCDPKNIDYLRRYGSMDFKQMDANGKVINTASLSVHQDGIRVAYRYGNNTYYQWGRKDAMVGFIDHENEVKRNFGPKQYGYGKQPVKIEESILHPELFYCKGKKTDVNWSKTDCHNFWRASRKTVYDPCPPGYRVPQEDVFKIIGKANVPNPTSTDKSLYKNDRSINRLPLLYFNGQDIKYDEASNGFQNPLDPFIFRVSSKTKSTQTESNTLWFTSTGNRWFTDEMASVLPKGTKGGQNFNPTICYLWSASGKSGVYNNSVNGLALGKDYDNDSGENDYVVCPLFGGRRALGRPIRAIREK